MEFSETSLAKSMSHSGSDTDRSDREDTIAGSSTSAMNFNAPSTNLEFNGDGNQSDDIQSVLTSLDEHQSKFSSLSTTLREELDRLKALLAEKDKKLGSASLIIRQNEQKMAEMQRELESKNKEIEALNAKDEDWSNQVMVLRGSNELQKKELEAQKKESEDKMQAFVDEQKSLNQALEDKTSAVTMDSDRLPLSLTLWYPLKSHQHSVFGQHDLFFFVLYSSRKRRKS